MFVKSGRVLCLFLLVHGAFAETDEESVWTQEWEARFEESSATGTFVLIPWTDGAAVVHNPSRAQRPFRPASTFKIANAAIALDIGAVRDLEEVLPYGGGEEYFDSWEQDMNLKEAMRRSNVAIFHQVARRVGLDVYRSRLEEWVYGNGDPGDTLENRFWLTGPLEVTAWEQARFLKRLGMRDVDLKARTADLLRETLLQERIGDSALYAKTGWVGPEDPQIGWWVGWVEGPNGVSSFALNLDIVDDGDATLRVPLGKACLNAAGIWPPAQ